MILYKFKSLVGDGFVHALDMIVNERIYLSTCETMNDPHEGGFMVQEANEIIKRADPAEVDQLTKVGDIINKTKFTCFTKSASNPLLWAHYAGGYTGIAFKYNVSIKTHRCVIKNIDYGVERQISMADCRKMLSGVARPYDYGILLNKKKEWEYENEIRVFSIDPRENYLKSIKPIGIVLGPRGQTYDSVFNKICRKYDIPVGDLIPGKHGYEVYFPD